ncbi:MAG: hypothetical protein KatS3mg105_4209 [Gemmatales bacterium]|nr:MAG: hypothetical protein KatS3mg105_4209 [Gemmatales bacterium]
MTANCMSSARTGIFHCLDASTGKKIWRHDLLKEFQAQNLPWGVSFSPLVDGELVYTNPGGGDGNSLAAFNKKTGKLVWKALSDKAGYASPMAADLGGRRQIIFFTGQALVGVTPDKGQLLWRFPWQTDYDCNIATPIILGNHVFISSGYNRGVCAARNQTPRRSLPR